jgi:hypothetical protein
VVLLPQPLARQHAQAGALLQQLAELGGAAAQQLRHLHAVQRRELRQTDYLLRVIIIIRHTSPPKPMEFSVKPGFRSGYL